MPKLFKISQDINNDWDTYDSAIVIADSEEEARHIHPLPVLNDLDNDEKWWESGYTRSWAHPEHVSVVEVGLFISNPSSDKEERVICSSFNAG